MVVVPAFFMLNFMPIKFDQDQKYILDGITAFNLHFCLPNT